MDLLLFFKSLFKLANVPPYLDMLKLFLSEKNLSTSLIEAISNGLPIILSKYSLKAWLNLSVAPLLLDIYKDVISFFSKSLDIFSIGLPLSSTTFPLTILDILSSISAIISLSCNDILPIFTSL